MTRWGDATRQAPDLTARVQERFETYGLGILGTIRLDGAPRLSGIEPLFALGELWLGMMLNSRKARDLTRDPRCALHNATVDKDVRDGDAKIGGRAVEVTDASRLTEYRRAFSDMTENDVPDGPFHLFTLDVTEISILIPAGDHLVIDLWTPKDGQCQIDRY